MVRGLWVVLVLGLVLMGVTGCWNPFSPDDGGGGGDGQYDRTNPDKLLNFFASAYVDKNVDRYGEALDDDFSFEFLSDDYTKAGVDSVTPYWGKGEDVENTGNMFGSPKTFGITFDFGLPIEPWYETTVVLNPGKLNEQTVQALWTRRQPDIQVVVDEGEAELTTFWVNNSRLIVTVVQDRYDSKLWRVHKIEETKLSG